MASKKDEYEFKTVRRMKDVQRALKDGWEVAESSGKENWLRGNDYQAILRRPNPKYRGPKQEVKTAEPAPQLPPPPAPANLPAANWYPDPDGPAGQLRYWDGTAWTENRHQQ